MANVYSVTAIEGAGTAGGTYSATPPAGTAWIISDISVVSSTSPALVAVLANGHHFWSAYLVAPASGVYGVGHWTGRQVVNFGQNLVVQCFQPAEFRVCAYQLTLP